MRDPLHALLLLADEHRIARVLDALRRGGYDARASYAHTPQALASALGRRRWDAVIGDVAPAKGHVGAEEAATILQGKPAAPPLFALHPDPSADAARAARDAGARAVFAPDALGRLARAVSDAHAERRRRRHAAPPPRRPLAPDIADHLPVGVYQTSREGEIVYANAALAALLGAPSAEHLIGQHVSTAYGYPRQAFLDAMQRAGEVRALDVAWTRPDGRRLHTREHARALHAADGSVSAYEGTIAPVPLREDADRHAAAAERQRVLLSFRLAADRATDDEALYTAARDAAERVLGAARVVLYGDTGDENALAARASSAAFADTDLGTIAVAYPDVLPEALDTFADAHRLRPAVFPVPRTGRPEGRLVCLVDARRRLHADERADAATLAAHTGAALDALQARRELLTRSDADRRHAAHAEAVAGLGAHGFALDPAGRVAWCTDGVTAALGRSPSELDARTLLGALHPADRRAVLRAAVRARRADGARVAARAEPGRKRSGRPPVWEIALEAAGDGALYVSARDDSAERSERDALARRLSAAEQERHVFTRLLTHASHQLRTPLTGIIGFADVVADETDGQAHEHARMIAADSRTLSDLLTGFLTLARPHPDGVPLEPEPVDAAEEVRRTLDLLAPLAEEDGLRFETSYPKRPVEAEVDRAAFARLLYALVAPAIASSGSGGRIRIEVARRGGQPTVTVAAPSLGVARPDGAPALEAARALAERMGARLALSSRPGGLVTASLRLPTTAATSVADEIEELRPSDAPPPDIAEAPLALTFDLTEPVPAPELADLLPLAFDEPPAETVVEIHVPDPPARGARPERPPVAPQASPEPPAAPESAEERDEEPAPAERLSVLAVEDNDDNRLLLERLIGDGIDLDAVADARTALARMAQRRYDVLLLDINLGRNQNGADVLRIARTLPGYADVYAIAFTAHDGPEQRVRFAAAGFDAHLAKPFSRKTLREAVAGALSA